MLVPVQALANTLQALSKLGHYSGPLCTAAELRLSAALPNFPPRELSSLLSVFVHLNHAPSSSFWQALTSHLLATKGLEFAVTADTAGAEPRLNHALDQQAASSRQQPAWQPAHWSTLVWAAGKLAWHPPSDLWTVIEGAVHRHLDDFKPFELCNIMW